MIFHREFLFRSAHWSGGLRPGFLQRHFAVTAQFPLDRPIEGRTVGFRVSVGPIIALHWIQRHGVLGIVIGFDKCAAARKPKDALEQFSGWCFDGEVDRRIFHSIGNVDSIRQMRATIIAITGRAVRRLEFRQREFNLCRSRNWRYRCSWRWCCRYCNCWCCCWFWCRCSTWWRRWCRSRRNTFSLSRRDWWQLFFGRNFFLRRRRAARCRATARRRRLCCFRRRCWRCRRLMYCGWRRLWFRCGGRFWRGSLRAAINAEVSATANRGAGPRHRSRRIRAGLKSGKKRSLRLWRWSWRWSRLEGQGQAKEYDWYRAKNPSGHNSALLSQFLPKLRPFEQRWTHCAEKNFERILFIRLTARSRTASIGVRARENSYQSRCQRLKSF